RLYGETRQARYLEESRALVNWVVSRKTPYHAWHYTDPGSTSGIGHDNYHTGGILDGIGDYIENTQDYGFMDVYLNGLKFYADRLFTDSGAPKLTDRKKYPLDIHGAAQGILTFAKASKFNRSFLDLASSIALWGISGMQDSRGYFYYRKHRLFTLKYLLMRWNNSWMAWALSELLARHHGT
ncbi:MAG: hypothetical protein JXJ19_05890, partial [Elusimicrobia bacterium]|nr:hypothetical protein [Elusimicrobiota bacterium]